MVFAGDKTIRGLCPKCDRMNCLAGQNGRFQNQIVVYQPPSSFFSTADRSQHALRSLYGPMHRKESRPARCAVILVYCSVRDWHDFAMLSDSKISETPVHTLSDSLWVYFFPLWGAHLKVSRFAVEITGGVWTETVSEKKKLRIQKYPDTNGRGLRVLWCQWLKWYGLCSYFTRRKKSKTPNSVVSQSLLSSHNVLYFRQVFFVFLYYRAPYIYCYPLRMHLINCSPSNTYLCTHHDTVLGKLIFNMNWTISVLQTCGALKLDSFLVRLKVSVKLICYS